MQVPAGEERLGLGFEDPALSAALARATAVGLPAGDEGWVAVAPDWDGQPEHDWAVPTRRGFRVEHVEPGGLGARCGGGWLRPGLLLIALHGPAVKSAGGGPLRVRPAEVSLAELIRPGPARADSALFVANRPSAVLLHGRRRARSPAGVGPGSADPVRWPPARPDLRA